MKIAKLAVFSALFLAGCGGASQTDIDEALVNAWSRDSIAMSQLAGVDLPGSDPGALRGLARSAQAAQAIASGYAGETAAGVAGAAINGVAQVASDFGVEGASEVRDSVGIATASDWTVRNLEVLSQRESGNEHVALVRYDLSATINGTTATLAKDVTHKIRLIDGQNGWEIEHRN